MLLLPSPPLPSVGVGRRRGGLPTTVPRWEKRARRRRETEKEEEEEEAEREAGEEEGKDEKRERLLPHFFLEAVFFFFFRFGRGRGRGRGRTLKQEEQGKGGRIYMPAKKVGDGEAPFLSFSGGRVGRREGWAGGGKRRSLCPICLDQERRRRGRENLGRGKKQKKRSFPSSSSSLERWNRRVGAGPSLPLFLLHPPFCLSVLPWVLSLASENTAACG